MIQRYLLPSVLIPAHMTLVVATAMLASVQRTAMSLCGVMMEATDQTKALGVDGAPWAPLKIGGRSVH